MLLVHIEMFHKLAKVIFSFVHQTVLTAGKMCCTIVVLVIIIIVIINTYICHHGESYTKIRDARTDKEDVAIFC